MSLLTEFPIEDGVRIVSPPQRFDGGEEAYDVSVGGAGREDLLKPGRGAWRLAQHHAKRPIERWLEVGAGGGTCTLGLVAASPDTQKVVTDTSAVFLGMIRDKLAKAGIEAGAVDYATLAGEDLSRLSPQSLDLIVVASAVHHVGDWRGFIADAASLLRPGGVMVIQEPFREGYLLMALAIEIVLNAAWSAHLSAEDRHKIEHARNAIYFLANSALPKDGEDKHNFLIDEVASAGDAAGFSNTAFYVNTHLETFAQGEIGLRRFPCSLTGYLGSYLQDHHRVSQEAMLLLMVNLGPILQPLEGLYFQGDGPALLGCVAFTR